MQKEIDTTVDSLIKEANTKSTTFDKLKVFHDYLVLNSTFEKSDEAGNYNQTIYNAFSGGTSKQGNIQCAGYAKAMQYLCDKAGIDCMVITGTNEKGTSHAWDKVKVEGEWYNIDATWDDPILSLLSQTTSAAGEHQCRSEQNADKCADLVFIHKNYSPSRFLRHDYFLVSDEEINGISHFPDTEYLPDAACTDKGNNYFISSGLYFDSYTDGLEGLSESIKKAARNGSGEAEIRFENEAAFSEVCSYLYDQQGLKEIIEELNANDGLKISSAHHIENSSLYVIHISLIF